MSFFVVIVIVFLAVWQSYSPLRVPSLDPSDSNYLLNAKAMQFGGNGGWVDTDLCVVPVKKKGGERIYMKLNLDYFFC